MRLLVRDAGPSLAQPVRSGVSAAMHKLGQASKHALERADASLHRAVHRDKAS